MTPEWDAAAIALAVILCVMRYLVRVEDAAGRILARDVQEHLEAWERAVVPRLGMSRERAAQAAETWAMVAVALEALVLARLVLTRVGAWSGAGSGWWRVDAAGEWLVGLLLTVVICGEVIPFLMMQRLRGDWLAPVAWLVRGMLVVMAPVTVVIQFLLSIASLTEPESASEDESGDVEALLEAGEEEGILEEQDRQLVRSALEFGDKLVKEVMTPRSAVFAVPEDMLLRDFVAALARQNYSRVPVYRGTLDEVTGIAFARDLLHVSDEEKAVRTVGSMARLAALVPETKRGYDLLREMQREKQHMRVVIDEYGDVAGVVTIEDLLEEIVGAIRDEHEDDAEAASEEAASEEDGAWRVPGGFPADRLVELVGGEWVPDGESYESQTVGGLVTEIADRIPLAGEVVEAGGLRMEIVKASERRVEVVRVRRVEHAVERMSAAAESADADAEPHTEADAIPDGNESEAR